MKIAKTIGPFFFLLLSVLPLVIYAQPMPEIYLTGVDLASQGKFSEAKKIFQEILAADPSNERADGSLKIIADLERQRINNQTASHLFKGLSYFYKNNFQEALAQANLALKINPEYERAYNVRGSSYFALAKDDQALADFNRALEIEPKYEGAYYNRGCVYLRRKQYEGAISDLDRALKIKPIFASAFHNRGMAHMSQGEYLWALADFNRALEINPRLAQSYLNQGVVLEELDREKEAVEAYKKFLQYASPELSGEINYARNRLKILEK
jgi:tetratricopeptide (TPR) repeat protein